MEIKDNIVRILGERGMTQRDLCALLGVTVQSLQYYFRGNITLSKLRELSSALGVESWELLRPVGGVGSGVSDGIDSGIRCPHCGAKLSIRLE